MNNVDSSNISSLKVAIERKQLVTYTLKGSFMLTYILLLTTGTITLIEALRTSIPNVRHIMNLETVISIVAGYFYSTFISKLDTYEKEGKSIDWEDITKTRYLDWSITTPIMLLGLCIVLTHNVNKKVRFSSMMLIIALNYTMLLLGYLGEIQVINRIVALIGGFIPFFAMFYIIYIRYVKPYNNSVNKFLLGFYVFFWSFYGIVYEFPIEYKNIILNILDLIAKCLIGIGFWIYYTNLLVWK